MHKQTVSLMGILLALCAPPSDAGLGIGGEMLRGRLSLQPLGSYTKLVDPDGQRNFLGGGFWLITGAAELRLTKLIGVEVYGSFKGYRFRHYQEDPNGFVAFWGLPTFDIGVGPDFHLLRRPRWELGAACGIEYDHYIANDVDAFPGLGFGGRLYGTIFLGKHVGAGLQADAGFSSHEGGPLHDGSGGIKYDFELYETSIGVFGVVRL